MKRLAFQALYGMIRVFSLLPLRVLYLMSGIIRIALKNIFAYRRKVIFDNLLRCFPEKGEAEIHGLVDAFYRYFSRLIAENIKAFDFNREEIGRHIRFRDTSLIDRYYEQGRPVVAIAAHYGNWEWLQGLAPLIKHKPLAVYKPLSDHDSDRLLNKQRARFGASMVSMREVIRTLRDFQKEGIPTLSMYICDQSPVWEEIQYWTTFLGQQTPVYLGPEKIARELGAAVVYFRMHVIARGRYEVEIIPLCEDARREEEYRITEKHVALLEESIREDPVYWLWSHRRWKLTRKREQEEHLGIYRFDGQFIGKHRKSGANA